MMPFSGQIHKPGGWLSLVSVRPTLKFPATDFTALWTLPNYTAWRAETLRWFRLELRLGTDWLCSSSSSIKWGPRTSSAAVIRSYIQTACCPNTRLSRWWPDYRPPPALRCLRCAATSFRCTAPDVVPPT